MPLPPSSSQTRSTRQHNPNRRGNQNVHLLFAVAGELLSRGKKQAELSAIGCFLGLAPSFLRGGPGRFVLVPSCSSAPLSGGLCRPQRNAARDPRGLCSKAPPCVLSPGLQPPERGPNFCSLPSRPVAFCQPLPGQEREPHQRGFPALPDTPGKRGSKRGIPARTNSAAIQSGIGLLWCRSQLYRLLAGHPQASYSTSLSATALTS